MKNNIFLWCSIACLSFAFAKAQTTTRGIKVAVVNMEYILENVPEYQKAKQDLDLKMQQWNGEIQAMKTEIEQMEKALQSEKVLLTKELIEEKEEDIRLKQEDLLKYQQKRFGPEGDFKLQSVQLIQPVQDQVFNEVQKISELKKYDFIMDSSEVNLLYSADRHDLSDEILRAIGRTAKTKDRSEKKDKPKSNAKPVDENPYLSVIEAEEKEAKIQAKEEILNAREAAQLAKVARNDSIKAARAKQYEQRREELQRRRDSILAARAKAREKKE